jgi:hypothetical protein
MSLQLTLQANGLGQQANLVVVEFIYSGSTSVTVTESDYSQFLVAINVGAGALYSDIAAALAATVGCPVTATYSSSNPAGAGDTGAYLGLSGATDGQGEGQYYNGIGGRRIFILPQYIKRKQGWLGH